jgi:hypothetical protein
MVKPHSSAWQHRCSSQQWGLPRTPKQKKLRPGQWRFWIRSPVSGGIKFGTTFSDFKEMALDQDHGKLKLYTKTNEDLKLGLAKLDTIVYHFFDDKFYGVSIHTNDPANTQTLFAIAGTGFGQGAKLDQQNTIWQGEKAWAQLSQNPGTAEGTLFIGDCELSRQLGEYEQRAALEAAAQL